MTEDEQALRRATIQWIQGTVNRYALAFVTALAPNQILQLLTHTFRDQEMVRALLSDMLDEVQKHILDHYEGKRGLIPLSPEEVIDEFQESATMLAQKLVNDVAGCEVEVLHFGSAEEMKAYVDKMGLEKVAVDLSPLKSDRRGLPPGPSIN